MKTNILSFLVSLFLLISFVGCQKKSESNLSYSTLLSTSMEQNNSKIKNEKKQMYWFFSHVFKGVPIIYTKNMSTSIDKKHSYVMIEFIGDVYCDSYKVTEYDTLYNYYSIYIKNHRITDSKYICYSNYLKTLQEHPEHYPKVLKTTTSFVQYFEIVINDKLSYFGKVQIDGVNGKITPESIDRIKSSYKEFLKFKTEVGGC